jgi:hypothetical protein
VEKKKLMARVGCSQIDVMLGGWIRREVWMNFDCKAAEIESLKLMRKRRFFGGMKSK